MLSFRQYLKESSLRDELDVPQNPDHHPEGKVHRHTLMVRAALDQTIQMIKDRQEKDPNGPLSLLDLNFSNSDMNVLRLGALLHDVGKGNALDPATLSAHGHEDPNMFEPAMKRLGPQWQGMYAKASSQDKDDLWFIISNHMSLSDKAGMPKSLWRKLVDQNGNYKNERKVKLLLALFLMDRMGRGAPPGSREDAKKFVYSNTGPGHVRLDAIDATHVASKKQLDKERLHTKAPAPDSPEAFISHLRANGRPDDVIKKALKGKRPDLSPDEIDSFF